MTLSSISLASNLLVVLAVAPRLVCSFSASPLQSTVPTSNSRQGPVPPGSLLQNWWPVSLTSALDPTKPNRVDLLGQQLVLFYDATEPVEEARWNCLKDQCSHRFAPLSEGRIVSNCLQCAYHGWEFNGEGTCTKIPQLTSKEQSAASTNAVPNYPVRTGANMVWIWADADAHELAETVPLPISPLLQQFLKDYPDSGYMRDLPYGMELLGENPADLSHLPFSHHSVAGFDRNDAKPLNLKLWSEEERTKAAKKEVKAVQEASKGSLSQPIVVPRFQATVLNAAETDPSMIARSKFKRAAPNNNTMATTAFYDPCHIRYRRLFGASNSDKTNGANIEMFLCPIGPGKSRVMLFNSFERFLQHNLEAAVQEKKTLFGRCKQRFIHSRIRNYFLGASARGHHDLNDIFDGDAVFLNQQGLQMATEGLKPADYSTPSTADVAVRSFRRWLDAASAATDRTAIIPTHAAKMAVKSVAGPLITDPTRADRTTMLDRYNQHTKNCKVCSEALAGLQRRQKVLARLSSFLLGVSGSAVTLAVFSAVSSLAGNLAKRFSSILAIASIFASWLVRRHAGTLCQKIQEFHYVGYAHSTKDYY